jgi:hypothetical protein
MTKINYDFNPIFCFFETPILEILEIIQFCNINNRWRTQSKHLNIQK